MSDDDRNWNRDATSVILACLFILALMLLIIFVGPETNK